MKFTNRDIGPRYIHSESGVVIVNPGETSEDLKVSEAELNDMRTARVAGFSGRHLWGFDQAGDGETNRVFLAIADGKNGEAMQILDLGNARFIGQFVGKTVSTDPDDWRFEPIREGDVGDSDKGEDDDASDEGGKPLSRQNKPELIETAKGLEIEVPEDATSGTLLKLIREKRKANEAAAAQS